LKAPFLLGKDYFSSETMEANRKYRDIFKCLKKTAVNRDFNIQENSSSGMNDI
jgi:hypothetical protein